MPAELDRTMLEQSATGAASALSAALNATATTRAYITGYEIVCGGATGATQVNATITGLSNTINIGVNVPAGANAPPEVITDTFPPIPATGLNTNIVLSLPNPGAGNTVESITIRGFRLTEP